MPRFLLLAVFRGGRIAGHGVRMYLREFSYIETPMQGTSNPVYLVVLF